MSSSQGRKQCKDPKTVRVYVIDNASSCENLLQSFRSRYTFEMSYIGLDCEWVDKKGQVNAPVALLQIATPLFDCFLVRLCKMDGQMPKAVKQILEDSAILKFGVGIQNDAKRLSEMFGIQVRGCVDLRHIITKRTQLESGDKLSTQRADSLCQGVIDVTFQGGKKKVHLDGKDSNPNSPEKSHKSYKNVPITGSALCTNCILTAPDGSKLTTTSLKRAKWYIAKELGHLTNDDPYTVQLNFEPAGRPGTDDYCLTFKHNKCVVCGSDETYNMTKKVVPSDYRCHFPPAMKEHNSHDVLLTCPPCNSLAYFHDNKLRKKLAIEFNAPLESASMPRLVEDPKLRKVKWAAKALSHADSHNIPEHIRQEYSLILQKHFSDSALTPQMISQAAAMETFKENPNFVSHGLEVVKRVSAEGKLMEFQKMCRKHFVDTMHPKFLPPQWSVDYRHEILKGESRDCLDH